MEVWELLERASLIRDSERVRVRFRALRLSKEVNARKRCGKGG